MVSASTLRSRFVARRHTALLAAIITVFAARPVIGDSEVASVAVSVALLLVLLLALYTI